MEGDTKKPPPFFCPACGQKHRAPIDNLLANPGAVLRVSCSGCTKRLAVSLNADGTLACTLASDTTADVTAPAPEAAPAPKAPRRRTRPASSA